MFAVGALVATGADSFAIVMVDVTAMGFVVVVGDLTVVAVDLTVDIEANSTLVEVPVAGFADVGTLLGMVLVAGLAIFATFSARAGASTTCFVSNETELGA